MVFWKMSRFVHNFLPNYQMVPNDYALSHSYLYFWDILDYFHFSCPSCALVALKHLRILVEVLHIDYIIYSPIDHRSLTSINQIAVILNHKPSIHISISPLQFIK